MSLSYVLAFIIAAFVLFIMFSAFPLISALIGSFYVLSVGG